MAVPLKTDRVSKAPAPVRTQAQSAGPIQAAIRATCCRAFACVATISTRARRARGRATRRNDANP